MGETVPGSAANAGKTIDASSESCFQTNIGGYKVK